MIPLFTPNEFETARYRQNLPLQCKECKQTFYRTKHQINKALQLGAKDLKDFCSQACNGQNRKLSVLVSCQQCGKAFTKTLSHIKHTIHNFCSQSCAATYSNQHKTTGTRRSKLEIWLEKQLTQLYPKLKFDFNKTDAIEAELDIYIPELNLAFELNGVFHYEPIYGADKLKRVHENDHRKFLACAEHGIELCVIDNSKMRHFKETAAQKFLDIIQTIIVETTERQKIQQKVTFEISLIEELFGDKH